MEKDKDLKKKIQAEFEKPEKSFDNWAMEHGISLPPADNVRQVQLSGTPARHSHIRGGIGVAAAVKRGVLIAIPLLIIAAIIIPVLVVNTFVRRDLPALYGYNDVKSQRITIDEVEAVPNVYLFDMSGVVQTESVTKEVLKDDESFVLSYVLTNNLLSVANGDTMDAFYVTYRVRIYENYEFLYYTYYKELTHTANVNGHEVSYDLSGSQLSTAYAKFTADGYEYFIEASGFDGITDLTEDNFVNLLNKILL